MLRHIVMLRWSDSTTDDQKGDAAAGFRALPDRIPQIKRLTCGPDLGLAEGGYDFAAVLDFDSAQEWREYQNHPAHRDFVAATLKPMLADRAAIQFDLG
ncbi:Dabb family protein [Salinactinospora qingdaonensis]|uniref:Dabb family protein n=1 Tax=Salinactinospora qingdaonensis TaxID=702744 RepID=A0ABP7FJT3_9ACTN